MIYTCALCGAESEKKMDKSGGGVYLCDPCWAKRFPYKYGGKVAKPKRSGSKKSKQSSMGVENSKYWRELLG